MPRGLRSIRFSVKTRLALLCGALFLASGAVLLLTNYFLVRTALPSGEQTDTPNLPATGPTGTVELSNGVSSGADASQLNIAQYRESVLNTLLVQSGVTLVIMAALALLLGWFAAHRMLRPVHEVASTARRLGADNLDQRIRMQGPRDELTELADTFDDMLDRLAASFDSQKRFVANASHELRTPLSAQRTMIEVAMNRPSADPSMRDLCGRLLTMNERTESLIEGLLVLARSDRGLDNKEPVRLDEVAGQVVDGHRQSAARAGVVLHAVLSPRVVHGDRVLLERLTTNLVENAIAYNHRGGEVWLSTGGDAALEVGNTGPLVPAEAAPTLFEPFRQLHRQRTGPCRGAGLGLSIVASIARAHGGSVRAAPKDGGGLDVSVKLA